MNYTQQRLFDFINQNFEQDSTIHFLALSTVEHKHDAKANWTNFKVP